MSRYFKLAFSFTFTFLFIFWIIRNINLTETLTVLRTTNLIWLIPALIFFLISVILRAYRWKILLQSFKNIAFRHVFSASMIGYLANNILPFRMGEIVRAYVLGEIAQITKIGTLSNIMIERLCDVSTMFVFFIIGSWLVELSNWMQNIRMTATAIIIIAYIGLIFLYLVRTKFLVLFDKIANNKLLVFIRQLINHILEGLTSIHSLKNLLLITGLSLIGWFAEVFTYLFVGKSIGLPLSVFPMMIVLAIVNLGGAIPSSPGFVGNFEFFAVQSLLFFGIEKPSALSFAILLHLLLYFPVTILGVFYVWREKIDIGIYKTKR